MKKGDIKKQEIIQTAEMLFCRYGYNETSVQDILDAIHTSKGSFYHHFESKEQVLQMNPDFIFPCPKKKQTKSRFQKDFTMYSL